jgi:hypothetical protein
VLSSAKGDDGGINPARSISQSDACINGMFLNYACYFAAPERDLRSVVDFLIAQQMPDGGYNCRKNRSGARHSSLHSTISVLEGVTSYVRHNYTYRAEELGRIAAEAEHFALEHRLYKSDHTGKIIHPGFLRFPYPTRWYYNILRGLDYFRAAGRPLDPRMHDALTEVVTKQRPDGRFSVNAAPPGAVHMVMEPAGKPSRWITLVALRVLNAFGAGRTAARV